MKQDFQKIKSAIRYWQLGRGYTVALRAMDFAEKHHTGLRKDGVTPEFQHQVSQVNFARTLIEYMQYPEETLATIWLHDIVEDCGVPVAEIERLFGKKIGEAVELMTNAVFGVKKNAAQYYNAMLPNEIASLAKGIDRIHNHQSMHGVFKLEKQAAYIKETNEFIMPLLKAARRIHPEQEPAYQNIKHVLQVQMELIDAFLQSASNPTQPNPT